MYIHRHMHTCTDAIAINKRRDHEFEGQQEGFVSDFVWRSSKGEHAAINLMFLIKNSKILFCESECTDF